MDANWVTAVATVVIAVAAVANVVVYLLLWKQTKRSVDEMRTTAEFMIMQEITKKFSDGTRSNYLERMFPGIADKYWRRL